MENVEALQPELAAPKVIEPAELLPCPFCGDKWPVEYISRYAAVLSCTCGATIRDACVPILYRVGKVPLALLAHIYEAKLLVMRQKSSDGTVVDLAWPDHGMVGVNLLAALEHAGVTAKWNRRVTRSLKA